MDDVQIAELKKKYNEIYKIEYGDQVYYFRKPGRSEFKRYYDKLLESPYDALTTLIVDTIIEPTREDLLRHIEQDPTIPTKIGLKLTDFFGSQVSGVHKL